MADAVVTRLRARGPRRIQVDLDGRPWRVVPTEVITAAGLSVGGRLDRETARTVGRELRRHAAEATALRALGARDHSRASLEHRLAERRIAPALRAQTLDRAQRAGLVDDARFATGRAELLAGRGAGDLLIAYDLERNGIPIEVARRAIAELDPEAIRATGILDARGSGPRTLRYLASKGFSEATLEPLVAECTADGVG